MIVRINSAANSGIETIAIDVEVSMAGRGLPGFDIVGLPDKAVDESKERVRTAIQNSGLEFPRRKIMVNLAPADVPKEGSFYDMPIAAGVLALNADFTLPKDSLFVGELSLDGSFRHVRCVILFALFAKENGYKHLFVPRQSANEAAIISEVKVYPTENLLQLLSHLKGEEPIEPLSSSSKFADNSVEPEFDMREIIGQEQAKRAAEIAAAGGHNMLMVGPPGSGKTMIARAIPGILPLLSEGEALEVTKIYSAAGNIPAGGGLVMIRPFRTPHHTTSQVGLIGGGTRPRPGEISLAHRGVLFLDEFNEFSRFALEAMRQPLEDGRITISRSQERAEYPAKFMLIASANPCPCGYLGHPKRQCICTPRMIAKYQKKVSGPIKDRIDLHVRIKPVDVEKLKDNQAVSKFLESSAEIRKRVMRARNLQERRFAGEFIHSNSEMKNAHIKKHCRLSSEVEQILRQASRQFQLSARSYMKAIKTARTIADLAGSSDIAPAHMAEALQYSEGKVWAT